MHNKTVSKILIAILTISMFSVFLSTLPASAVSLIELTPTSGNVGTQVRLVGTIDTLGGSYAIYFDTNGDGSIQYGWANETVKTGNAPADTYDVNTTFVVPACLGSDAGLNHRVVLRDEQTVATVTAWFAVVTSRVLTVSPTTIQQEGSNVTAFMTVTGGTVANQLNRYTVYVTDPAGGRTRKTNLDFTTSAVGSGSANCTIPDDFAGWGFPSSGTPNTDLCGTYTVNADRVLPGAITNASQTSFQIRLTNASSYGRFETVNVKTTGWATNQNVTVTITDPNGTVAQTWPNQNLTTGMANLNWTIPWNAVQGTYNVTVYNATGNNKAVTSTNLFEVGSAALTVTFTTNPTNIQRTQTMTARFNIKYPDGTVYNNVTHFNSITVYIVRPWFGSYYRTEGTIYLTAADYGADGNWTVTWTAPKGVTLNNGYRVQLSAPRVFGATTYPGSIMDNYGNEGAVVTTRSGSFRVQAATLDVMVVTQPMNVTRQQAVTAGLRITYPDGTAYTTADLNSVNTTIRVYANSTNVANVTLNAAGYNATANEWTISWTPSYMVAAGSGYNFSILANELYDSPLNLGPASTVTTNNFIVSKAVLVVPAVLTNDDTFQPGDYVWISFNATYPDGSPVMMGSSAVTLTAPDGFTTTTVNPVHVGNGIWQVPVWLSDAQAQTGAWTITLTAHGVNDGYNTGPAITRTANFTVLPPDYSLEDIADALNALSDRLAAVESDTSALGDSVTAINAAIAALEGSVADLESQLANTASTSSVTALTNTVNSLSAAIDALESALAGTASAADVDALSTAVSTLQASLASLETDTGADLDALSAAVDALEAAVADLSANAVTQADLDDTASDLSADIGSSNTLIIVAIVLALVAAVAAIAAVYIILKKIAG
jgi:hypothetical protein